MKFSGFRYVQRAGVYGQLDERARVLLAIAGILSVLLTWDALCLSISASAALGIVFASKVKWHEIRRFALFAGYVIALLVLLTFMTGEGSLEERKLRAAAQVLRMGALVGFTVVLPFTLHPARYGLTFRRLGCPDRLAFAVELAFRFVPSFGQRLERTIQAQAARGMELAPSGVHLLGRLRRLIPVLIPVLLDAIVAAEDVADAVDMRGFGTAKRTWTGPGRWTAAESMVLLAAVLLILQALALG